MMEVFTCPECSWTWTAGPSGTVSAVVATTRYCVGCTQRMLRAMDQTPTPFGGPVPWI